MELPYAEDIGHYWQTGSSSPDTWIDKAKKQIIEIGGGILAEGFGSSQGRSAYMIAFTIDKEQYKVIFPVLPSKSGRESAAKRQAATLLYHDIKAKCMVASVLGSKAAFFSYLLLGDGRVAGELSGSELENSWPLQLV